jgi:hypothetical protein
MQRHGWEPAWRKHRARGRAEQSCFLEGVGQKCSSAEQCLLGSGTRLKAGISGGASSAGLGCNRELASAGLASASVRRGAPHRHAAFGLELLVLAGMQKTCLWRLQAFASLEDGRPVTSMEATVSPSSSLRLRSAGRFKIRDFSEMEARLKQTTSANRGRRHCGV